MRLIIQVNPVIPKLLKYAAGGSKKKKKKKRKESAAAQEREKEKDGTSYFQLGRWKGSENAGNLKKPENKGITFLLELPEGMRPANTLLLAQ